MKEKDLWKVNLEGTKKYKRPAIITLSGLPGSGKTEVARVLSKELSVFLLSNDFIRNYYKAYYNFIEETEENYKKLQRLTLKINLKRLATLIAKRQTFIYDRDFNREKEFAVFKKALKTINVQLIKIKVKSIDFNNINRIQNRKINYNTVYNEVLGDNVEYSGYLNIDDYYKIKARKPQDMKDDFFDYILNNNCDIESLKRKSQDVAMDIKIKKLTK